MVEDQRRERVHKSQQQEIKATVALDDCRDVQYVRKAQQLASSNRYYFKEGECFLMSCPSLKTVNLMQRR